MAIKAISFRPQDTDLEAWAEQQENFSAYVRDLIERDMAIAYIRHVAPGMVRLVEELVAVKANKLLTNNLGLDVYIKKSKDRRKS